MEGCVKVWVNAAGGGYDLGHVSKDYESVLNRKSISNIKQVTVTLETGIRKTLAVSEVYLADNEFGFPDSGSLTYLTPPNLLENISQRFLAAYDNESCQNQIYTYTGWILLATNPYQELPALYDKKMLEYYVGKKFGLDDPHLFTLAGTAHSELLKNWKSQSVIISGESGSGKTESSKHVLKYLAYVSDPHHNTNTQSIELQVLKSNPILEAFGNASTIHNDNSSRFGKLMKLYFNKEGRMVSASIQTYLLGKSRICHLPAQEKNYHIFYWMCAGASDIDRSNWLIKDGSHYKYLNHSGESYKSSEEFSTVQDALEIIGLPKATIQQNIFKTLSAILHLGNLKFTTGTRADGISNVTIIEKTNNKDDLVALFQLLGLNTLHDQEQFELVLTSKKIRDTRSNLNILQAKQAADALARSLYQLLFDYLVRKINEALTCSSMADKENVDVLDGLRYIGILDIFGFENLNPVASNGFEQLCINFANDKLHQFFVNQFIVKERQLFIEEELLATEIHISQPDYCTQQTSVFDVLNEASLIPVVGSKDSFFCNKVLTSKQTSRRIIPSISKQQFTVQHYAGEVTYLSTGFCERNVDFITNDLFDFLCTNCNEFIKHMVKPICKEEDPVEPKKELFPKSAPSKTFYQNPKNTSVDFLVKKRQLQNETTAPPKKRVAELPSVDKFSNLRVSSIVKKSQTDTASSFAPKRKPVRPKTLAIMFLQQVNDLLNTLSSTNSYFVRCIRPNNDRIPKKIDSVRVLQQLESGGLFAILELMRAGFPCRISYSDIWEKFHPHISLNVTAQELTAMILNYLDTSQSNFRLGKTKAFFSFGTAAVLDAVLNTTDPEFYEKFMKKTFSFWLRRKRLRITKTVQISCLIWISMKKKKCRSIAEAVKNYFSSRGKQDAQEKAAIIIQKHWRGHLIRQLYTILKIRRDAAIKIQAAWKGYNIYTTYQHFRYCVIYIQTFWRSYLYHKESKQILQAVEYVQDMARCVLIRCNYLVDIQRQKAAVKIQRWWRKQLTEFRVVPLVELATRNKTAAAGSVDRGSIKRKLRKSTRSNVENIRLSKLYSFGEAIDFPLEDYDFIAYTNRSSVSQNSVSRTNNQTPVESTTATTQPFNDYTPKHSSVSLYVNTPPPTKPSPKSVKPTLVAEPSSKTAVRNLRSVSRANSISRQQNLSHSKCLEQHLNATKTPMRSAKYQTTTKTPLRRTNSNRKLGFDSTKQSPTKLASAVRTSVRPTARTPSQKLTTYSESRLKKPVTRQQDSFSVSKRSLQQRRAAYQSKRFESTPYPKETELETKLKYQNQISAAQVQEKKPTKNDLTWTCPNENLESTEPITSDEEVQHKHEKGIFPTKLFGSNEKPDDTFLLDKDLYLHPIIAEDETSNDSNEKLTQLCSDNDSHDEQEPLDDISNENYNEEEEQENLNNFKKQSSEDSAQTFSRASLEDTCAAEKKPTPKFRKIYTHLNRNSLSERNTCKEIIPDLRTRRSALFHTDKGYQPLEAQEGMFGQFINGRWVPLDIQTVSELAKKVSKNYTQHHAYSQIKQNDEITMIHSVQKKGSGTLQECSPKKSVALTGSPGAHVVHKRLFPYDDTRMNQFHLGVSQGGSNSNLFFKAPWATESQSSSSSSIFEMPQFKEAVLNVILKELDEDTGNLLVKKLRERYKNPNLIDCQKTDPRASLLSCVQDEITSPLIQMRSQPDKPVAIDSTSTNTKSNFTGGSGNGQNDVLQYPNNLNSVNDRTIKDIENNPGNLAITAVGAAAAAVAGSCYNTPHKNCFYTAQASEKKVSSAKLYTDDKYMSFTRIPRLSASRYQRSWDRSKQRTKNVPPYKLIYSRTIQ